MKLEFIAVGKAQPQGSLKAVSLPKVKHTILVSDNPKLRAWRKKVRRAAKAAMRSNGLKMAGKDIPLILQVQCCFKRPKTVTRQFMTTKPDASKLLRAIEDALTGVVYADDAQLVRSWAAKHYGAFERVEIRVEAAG